MQAGDVVVNEQEDNVLGVGSIGACHSQVNFFFVWFQSFVLLIGDSVIKEISKEVKQQQIKVYTLHCFNCQHEIHNKDDWLFYIWFIMVRKLHMALLRPGMRGKGDVRASHVNDNYYDRDEIVIMLFVIVLLVFPRKILTHK